MEKFRVQIEFTKKWHFWILFGLILLVSLAFWSIASTSLSALYDTGLKRLKGVESKMQAIAKNPKHPSEKSIKEMQAIIGKVEANPKSVSMQVLKAWKGLYRAMRRENGLPDLFDAAHGNDLDKTQQNDFVKTFNSLWGPLEEIEKKDGFKDNVRDAYGNHIHQSFPQLLNLIEWRHPETIAPGGAADRRQMLGMKQRGAADDKVKMVGIVDWVESDKDKVFGRFNKWTASPTTMQIMVAQEDLWVYESLLKVIRNTNNVSVDVKDPKYISPGTHKAARVKRILALEIGQEAVASWLKSDQSVFRAPAAAAAPGGGNAARIETTPRPGGGNSQGDALLINRYVDENGKPLEDASKQPFAEFRMMPIYMRVVIEQTAVTRLLAACANSSMRIDVTAVRLLTTPIAPYEPSTESAPAAQGAPPPPIMKGGGRGATIETIPPGGGMHHGSNGGGRGNTAFSSGPGAALPVDEEDASDPVVPPVTIEIEGVAYIYNKPDFGKVGTGAVNGGEGAAGGAAAHAAASDEDADSDDLDNPAATAPATPAAGNGATAPSGSGSTAPAASSAAPATTIPATSGTAPAAPAGPAAVVPSTGGPATDSSLKGTNPKDSGTKGTGP